MTYPSDIQVGDPAINYFNVEVTADDKFLVWLEVGSDGTVTAWHCGINADGSLQPSDGRGFKAYTSTLLNRPNTGINSAGVYYVGADSLGRVLVIEPISSTDGRMTALPITPDLRRRAFYPSILPNSNKRYVAWILNSTVAGGPTDRRNSWVELQYIDLDNPTKIIPIERQSKPLFGGMAPMDSGFFRWFVGKPALTFGAKKLFGGTQLKHFDLTKLTWVTTDSHTKFDPYPIIFGNREVILAGLDGAASLGIYTRTVGGNGMFAMTEQINVPRTTSLAAPALAQSAQQIIANDELYCVYQVNEKGGFDAAPGEIWLSTCLQSPQQQWRLSLDNTQVNIEPEPVGRRVYYSSASSGSLATAVWKLRLADTPL